jgi:hypothetical protein
MARMMTTGNRGQRGDSVFSNKQVVGEQSKCVISQQIFANRKQKIQVD